MIGDATLKTGVRSKDNRSAGIVVGIEYGKLTINSEGGRVIYEVPKSHVESFDGHEVFLNISFEELKKFEKKP